MMERAARVFKRASGTNDKPWLEPSELEPITIYQILAQGEGRLPITDITEYCKEVGITDRERMIRLVKLVEGEIISFQAEQREQQSKR